MTRKALLGFLAAFILGAPALAQQASTTQPVVQSPIPYGGDLINQTFVGNGAGNGTTTGTANTAFGYQALHSVTVPVSGANPQNDTVIGYLAGPSIKSARETTLVGAFAGYSLTGNGLGVEDGLNTAVGSFALSSETTGENLVAVGQKALDGCNGCSSTVGIGNHSGIFLTTATDDVLIGQASMGGGASGGSAVSSVAVGYAALSGSGVTSQTLGGDTAVGASAGFSVSAATNDVFLGASAGYNISSAARDVLIGRGSGGTVTTTNDIVAVGDQTCTACSAGAVVIGSQAANANAGPTDFVAIGYEACGIGGCGNSSTVVGYQAAEFASSVATNLTAIGTGAGQNAANFGDTYIGQNAGANITSGGTNTAVGAGALAGASGATGGANDAFGYRSGVGISTGANNTFLGSYTAQNVTTGSNNTCIGQSTCGGTLVSGSGNILVGYNLDTLTSSTSNEINIGGLLFYNNTSTAAPSVTSCGTSPSIDSHANDKSGTVTAGSGTVTSCTIAFASAYVTWDHCRVTSQSAESSFAYSYTKSAITVTATSLTSDLIDYDCDGL